MIKSAQNKDQPPHNPTGKPRPQRKKRKPSIAAKSRLRIQSQSTRRCPSKRKQPAFECDSNSPTEPNRAPHALDGKSERVTHRSVTPKKQRVSQPPPQSSNSVPLVNAIVPVEMLQENDSRDPQSIQYLMRLLAAQKLWTQPLLMHAPGNTRTTKKRVPVAEVVTRQHDELMLVPPAHGEAACVFGLKCLGVTEIYFPPDEPQLSPPRARILRAYVTPTKLYNQNPQQVTGPCLLCIRLQEAQLCIFLNSHTIHPPREHSQRVQRRFQRAVAIVGSEHGYDSKVVRFPTDALVPWFTGPCVRYIPGKLHWEVVEGRLRVNQRAMYPNF